MLVRCGTILATILAVATPLRAQQATTVQLPTFHFFTANTTVMAPDRGSALVGGVNRSAMARTERGIGGGGPLLGNRSIASTQGGGSIRTTATIIDLDEMDRAVLALAAEQAGEVRGGSVAGVPPVRPSAEELAMRKRAEFLSRNVATRPADELTPAAALAGSASDSPADIAARAAEEREAKRERAAEYFAQAEQAAADGKAALARMYYRIAAREGSEETRSLAARRLAEIAPVALRSSQANEGKSAFPAATLAGGE